MTWLANPSFAAADWLALFGHFLVLSMLAIGGAIATAPDMHRYVVGERHWMSDSLFTDSIALAQAAPGPNLLFVAVIGYNVAGLAGAAVTMLGILLPSTTFALWIARYGRRRQDRRSVRAFTSGMAPLTIGLVLATGWLLTEPTRQSPAAVALIAVTVLVAWRTKLSPLWPVGAGALVGALGWI
jgi:chromate transporter